MRNLFFLTVGHFRAPEVLNTAGRPLWHRGHRAMALTVAVCERDSGDLVLVDAGLSQATCIDQHTELGLLRRVSLQAQLQPADALAAQLRHLGYPPTRVARVIATHLHLDHIGGALDFPQAELVTTPAELKAYSSLPPNIGYRPADLAGVARIRLVRLTDGPRLGFPASHDLFGDGEVCLLEAPGHTRGHVAVALRGPDRLYVHVGDAVYQRWEYQLGSHGRAAGPCRLASLTTVDRDALLQTYACLRACATEPSNPVIVPSHDQEVFETLPHLPAGV